MDDPAPRVRRLTLNRPEKRNAISNALRTELYDALHAADRDPDVGVTMIRGAGPCFSSGYDLKSSLSEGPALLHAAAATARGRATSPTAGRGSGTSPSR